MLNGLEQKISSRDAQLAALENALLSKKLDEQIRPDGRPVRDGHISSYFGERQDPFTGHQAFHKGIDFASPQGSDVVAVAAGVVTFAGEKTGYGTLVEVSHGNGLVTRYGHNQGSRSTSAAPSRAAIRSRTSAPPAARPARTCTSKCSRTAARSIR